MASGSMSLGDVQAFIQYSRQFTQPITQIASMANLLQSGVASVERVFELLGRTRAGTGPASPRRPRCSRCADGWRSSTWRSATHPTSR